MSEKSARDVIDQLEDIEDFYEDPEGVGVVPLEVIESRGVTMPAGKELDDATLSKKLWEVIEMMATLGMYLESTDHLSDRELYDYLRNDALRESEMLFPDDEMFGLHISPIGGFSEEDIQIYLRHYADERERERFPCDPNDVLPPHQSLPYDRDRLLPTQEDRLPHTEQ